MKKRTSKGSVTSKVDRNVKHATLIKLGVDAHADDYWVVRQIENGPLQPPQRMSFEKFLRWAEKQRTLADRVVACYEAGTFGFYPARELIQRGV